MASSDQVLENPTSGQRLIFRKTAGDTARYTEYGG